MCWFSFASLSEPLTGQKYQEAVQQLENYYPGIFALEDNILDSELLQDEMDMLLEEERHLDNLVRMEE